jgi:hypothetical protein
MCNRHIQRSADTLPPPPPGKNEWNSKKYDCNFSPRYSLSDKFKVYPFSEAYKIEIASFPPAIRQIDSVGGIYSGDLPKKNKRIDFTVFKERLVLNSNQIDSLFNLLFNYGFKKDGLYRLVSHSSCFLAIKNAIIFYDKQGEYFAYIGFSFDCRDYITFPQGIDFGDFCKLKYEMIKAFMVKQGITYGLDDNE